MNEPRPDDEALALLALGELDEEPAAALRAAAEQDGEARRRLAELEGIVHDLSRPDPALADVDVYAGVHERLHERPRAGVRRLAPWVGALAAAAGLLLFVQTRSDDDDGFRARGSAAADPSRWAGVSAFTADGRQLVGPHPRIARDDALAFTVNNAGDDPFPYLMVLAVDAAGSVRWYHPAWRSQDEQPRALPIEPGLNRPLADAVRHALPPGPLRVYAVFLREPASVPDVDAAVAAAPTVPPQGEGWYVQTLELEVTP